MKNPHFLTCTIKTNHTNSVFLIDISNKTQDIKSAFKLCKYILLIFLIRILTEHE